MSDYLNARRLRFTLLSSANPTPAIRYQSGEAMFPALLGRDYACGSPRAICRSEWRANEVVVMAAGDVLGISLMNLSFRQYTAIHFSGPHLAEATSQLAKHSGLGNTIEIYIRAGEYLVL